MADITDQHDQTSPTELEDAHSVGNGNNNVGETRGIKRARPSTADDDDDDDDKGGRERRKIEIKFIGDKSRRHITFSKRKAGIMKKVRPSLTSSEAPAPAPVLGAATHVVASASSAHHQETRALTEASCTRPTNCQF